MEPQHSRPTQLRRIRALLYLALAATGAILVWSATTAAAPPTGDLVVRVSGARSINLAGYRPVTQTIGAAVARFGPPTSLERPAPEACHVRWQSVGMRIVFANFGGQDSCSPRGGRAQVAVVASTRWRTAPGLRVGQPLSRLRRLYPNAGYRNRVWWLVTAYSPIGEGGYYPVLAAVVRGKTVRAFRVHVGAAGD